LDDQTIEQVQRGECDLGHAKTGSRFAGVVYVLHAFQKKAKKGIATFFGPIAPSGEPVRSRRRDDLPK
jgi:hypothetical protein